jgi:hypothetical protein
VKAEREREREREKEREFFLYPGAFKTCANLWKGEMPEQFMITNNW